MDTGFHSRPHPSSYYHYRNTSTLIFLKAQKEHKIQTNKKKIFQKVFPPQQIQGTRALLPHSSSGAFVRSLI